MSPIIKSVVETAFRNRLSSVLLKNVSHTELTSFLTDSFKIFKKETKKALRSLRLIKTNCCLEAIFVKSLPNDDKNSRDEQERTTMFFQTKNEIISATENLSVWYQKNVFDVIDVKISEFQSVGSGWALEEIVGLNVNFNKYDCFNGSSHMDLPDEIANRKAIVNIQNTDNKCFLWSILAFLHREEVLKDSYRVSKYKRYENKLNMDGITYPVTLKQIDLFEKNNSNICVNVYMLEDSYENDENKKIVVPVRISKHIGEQTVHLLLLYDDSKTSINKKKSEKIVNLIDNFSIKTHYCWIKSLAKLIHADVTCHRGKIFVCDRCLHYFYSSEKLEAHSIQCRSQNECKVTLPTEEDKWLSFTNYSNQLEVDYIIYADIESILKTDLSNEQNMPSGVYQRHIAYTIGYYFHSRSNAKKSYYKSYSGKDCIEWFAGEITRIAKDLWPIMNAELPMLPIGYKQEEEFEKSNKCFICEQPFLDPDEKVHDHSHRNGLYRGAAHNNCNLKFKEKNFVPVCFHNLNYDLHFLIEALAAICSNRIDIIPSTTENYLSFTINFTAYEMTNQKRDFGNYEKHLKFRFIDSFRFMADSLQNLASYLSDGEKKITNRQWRHLSEGKRALLREKGVFPYDYIDSYEKLKEEELPPIKAFYNKLTDSSIKKKQYKIAKEIWQRFNIKTLQEYADIYLKTDVLLLADVFERFRDASLENYHLDPAHYFTTPGFTFDAMLYHTRVSLELITDIDQLLFIERG